MRKFIRIKIAKIFPGLYPFLRGFEVILSALIGRVHEQEFFLLKNQVPVNSLVIDIGANLGQSVTSLSRVCCPSIIIAFECNPNCQNLLPAVGRINRFLRGINFKFINKALGDFSHNFNFKVPVVNGVNYLQEGFLEGTVVNNEAICRRLKCNISDLKFSSYKVDVDVLDKYKFNPVLIKIDVQGAELSVLKGAKETIAQYSPILFIELPDDPLERDSLVSYIDMDLNYHIEQIGTNCICKAKKPQDL